MTPRARLWSGGVAAALLLFMVFLLFQGPRRTFGDYDQDVQVTCASVATVSWPGDHDFLSDASGSAWSDHISTEDANVDLVGRQGIANGCADARTTRLGFLVLLAMPTTLLATLTVLPGARRTRQVVPIPPQTWSR